MPLTNTIIAIAWIAWLVYWTVTAVNTKITQRRESVASQAAHLLPLGVAAVLLFYSMPASRWSAKMWPATLLSCWSGALLTVAGILFSVWARRALGKNWSGTVTIKQHHELIISGPYRIVRHPIYTGLILAFLGTAIALGEWRGVLAVAIMVAAFWRKLQHEERWMLEIFAAQYKDYKARVPALIPALC